MADFDLFKDEYMQAELPDMFIEAVGLALMNNRPVVGISAWIEAREHVRRWSGKTRVDMHGNKLWMERRGKWVKSFESMWERFFKTPQTEKTQCPCGEMDEGQSLRDHFRSRHWYFRAESGVKSGRKMSPDQRADTVSRGKKRRTRYEYSIR
ncbi:hypothetical protein L207DRAFT_630048 [Hyaloscypha variabilis F]|uniref:Uncharacterized protein n=1 Tax=Hyaloscypha variabilis (strain UAMH 11265 / GT02V1 / F) TaxID=1149755 RepID=A0A2J6S4D5_HYAVF|nr:hypothetical protein L207DRAFT_630048 [Hyaloscypha variabilis F]